MKRTNTNKITVLQHILTIIFLEGVALLLTCTLIGFDWQSILAVFRNDSPIIRIALQADSIRQLSFIDLFVILFCLIFLVSVMYLFTFRCIQHVFTLVTHSRIKAEGGMTFRMLVSMGFALILSVILNQQIISTDVVQGLIVNTFLIAFGFLFGCFWEWKSITSELSSS